MIGIFSNCQGAASRPFLRTLKLYIKNFNPQLICLFEPRVSGHHADKICSSLNFDEWFRIEALGFSGVLQVFENDNVPWFLSPIYGSLDPSLRKRLFAELTHHNCDINDPWLMAGDFNAVLSQEETSNTNNFSLSRCAGFRDWIFQEGLLDLGYTGTRFTWMRGTNSDSFKGARLDRVLCNVDWRLRFPDATVQHLPIVQSDHSPLFLNTAPIVPKRIYPRRFRFNAAWITHPDFRKMVQINWDVNKDVFENKSLLAENLDSWNRDTFGNIFHRKKRVLARLEGIQRSLCVYWRSDLLRLQKRLRKELDEILYQEELLWFQRSREE
ncbi:PREDICTED: uncharacterized protein LOC109164047 [Ipomoea nil]|uniref:uncharacterized protein LOC109164047 n=1 Tax=Ipomoea nil TaxID=35883 RepID=UPI000900DF2D|nr:PREDICTED: uncharacterized protein LOC109164047 [Ipomoea nil]